MAGSLLSVYTLNRQTQAHTHILTHMHAQSSPAQKDYIRGEKCQRQFV